MTIQNATASSHGEYLLFPLTKRDWHVRSAWNLIIRSRFGFSCLLGTFQSVGRWS